ncbi:MAG: hypothetical protein A3C02_02350 [Candidatus Andersenbacteria bacterium RIFCSPHIGHO2_02_FULL_45_11]|nr:MAG: hypothetical protein A2805_01780 [Candidatus Andersenbacteria bacterium RIFCSPHIGHO2_01_FULL_46_36]OGY34737.1 MAG: hypothetical protein A3C02_02350 [Candidatus Andersenbacteria bacterium RIFCSPHIGHO2_02_FULL_45_11]
MLYDVLPPLALFISFGGIIVLVSRVVLRLRNTQLTQQIHAEVAAGAPVHEESLLGPGTKGVQLVKNRLVHAAHSVKNSAVQIRDAARTIEMPRAGLKEKIAAFAQKGKESAVAFGGNIGKRIPDARNRIAKLRQDIAKSSSEQAPIGVVTPAIRLVRHTSPDTEKPEKVSLMSKIARRDIPETPLEKAANEIANKHFDTAEDILVPYIMKHASDPKAYVLLGNAAIGRQSWEEAMEIFQQVIKLDNSICEAYAQLGHAALNAGRFTQAIEALQHVRNVDAKNIQAREELLFIAQRMDNKVVEKGVAEELEELKKELA